MDGHLEIRGYDAVRAAAKDWASYSSDLLGDRDVRTYHQLPLEADPPRHALYREALQPLFMADAIKPHVPQFERLALDLIQRITERGSGEIGRDLALPYVIGCLTIIYDRPQDFDEWVSWGPDVWTAEAYQKGEVSAESKRAHRERAFDIASQRSGAVLDAYLRRVFDEAEREPKREPDVWDTVAHLEIEGRPITREEMYGIANVLLAGGRDTVIKLITGLTWHLMANPGDRAFLAGDETAFNQTIGEMVRYLSPLPKIERVLTEKGAGLNPGREAGDYVLLSWVSANFDRAVWPDPEVLDIHRPRKPHLAFGAGRHSCLGMNITENEAGAFLRTLLDHWPDWSPAGEPEIDWVTEGEGDAAVTVIDRFVAVDVVARG